MGDAAGVLLTVETAVVDVEAAADGVAVAMDDDAIEEGLATVAELLGVAWSRGADDGFVLEHPANIMTTVAPINGTTARLRPIMNPSQKICSCLHRRTTERLVARHDDDLQASWAWAPVPAGTIGRTVTGPAGTHVARSVSGTSADGFSVVVAFFTDGRAQVTTLSPKVKG